MNSYDIPAILYTVAFSVPFFLLDLVGILLSIIKRKSIGRAWIFSLIGFLLFFFATFSSVVFQLWLHFLMDRRNMADTLPTAQIIQSVFMTISMLLGTICLMIAIFAKREKGKE